MYPMMKGAHYFVASVFSLLAVIFIFSTVILLGEFGVEYGYALSALYSHTFLFYSTIALVALAAFHYPAVVFVHFYWTFVEPWGRQRFMIGTVAAVLLSVYLSHLLFGLGFVPKSLLPAGLASVEHRVPAIWELTPQTLTAQAVNDRHCPTEAIDGVSTVSTSVCKLRHVASLPIGFSTFIRRCPHREIDDLFEGDTLDTGKRYCFAARGHATASECCKAQKQFRSELSTLYEAEPKHSATLTAHIYTLPFKVFFMLVMLIIGFMLVFWRKQIDEIYDVACKNRLENGVMIGAGAMLFWPISNHAFLQSAAALFGSDSSSAYQTLLGPAFSVVFGLWALLIVFYFFRRFEADAERWGRMLGGIGSILAVLNYDRIIDLAVRFSGAGAEKWTYPALAIIGILILWSSRHWPLRGQLSDDGHETGSWNG